MQAPMCPNLRSSQEAEEPKHPGMIGKQKPENTLAEVSVNALRPAVEQENVECPPIFLRGRCTTLVSCGPEARTAPYLNEGFEDIFTAMSLEPFAGQFQRVAPVLALHHAMTSKSLTTKAIEFKLCCRPHDAS
eukprot:2634290-Amphidinium_carterae.1